MPRRGLLGVWDRVVGPGASRGETTVTLVLPPVAACVAWWLLPASATTLQRVLAAAIAFDVVGGVWVMSTPAARRWYHRPSRSRASRWAFALGHVHPFVLAWAFDRAMGPWAACLYGGMVLGTAVLEVVPPRLRASTAAVVVVVVLGVETALGGGPLVWFGAAYAMKLIVGHAMGDVPGE